MIINPKGMIKFSFEFQIVLHLKLHPFHYAFQNKNNPWISCIYMIPADGNIDKYTLTSLV